MARRIAIPRWFYWALGLLVAQHALVQGMENRNWTLPSALVLLGGCVVIVLARRRPMGLTVAIPTGPRSRGLLGLQVILALTCIWTAAVVGDMWVAAAATGVVLVATVVLGRAYDHALGNDLRDAGQPAG